MIALLVGMLDGTWVNGFDIGYLVGRAVNRVEEVPVVVVALGVVSLAVIGSVDVVWVVGPAVDFPV